MNNLKKLMIVLRGRYLVDVKTHVVHDLLNPHPNCHCTTLNESDVRRIGYGEVELLVEGGHDGCRWCMPKYNRQNREIKKQLKAENER